MRSVLLSLAKEKQETIFLSVISHPNYPLKELQKICDRTNTNKIVKEIALKNLYKPCLQKQIKLIDKCARQSQPSLTRLLALLNPKVHPIRLANNYRSRNWLERYAIATNPNTPKDIIK